MSIRKRSAWTIFIPAVALLLPQTAAWFACPDLLEALHNTEPDFVVLGGACETHDVVPSEAMCDVLAAYGRFSCPNAMASCVGPDSVFAVSALRMARQRIPPLPLSRIEKLDALSFYDGYYDDQPAFSLLSNELTSADWRALWHVSFGERDLLPSARCFGSPVNESVLHAHQSVPVDDAGAALDEYDIRFGESWRAFDTTQCPLAREFMASVDRRHAMPSDARHTLLITGGLGNIGLSLLRALMREPYPLPADEEEERWSWRVVVLDIVDRPLPKDLVAFGKTGRIKIEHVDIVDYAAVEKVLQRRELQRDLAGVLHLAAVSRVADCESNTTRCLAVNMRGTEVVLRALRATFAHLQTAPWLVFTSSREVFGDTGDETIDEHSTHNPVNVYGTSKAFAETYVSQHVDAGYRALTLRLSNVYGSWEDILLRVVPNFVCRAVADKPLRIVGGAQQLNLIHVSDVVRGIELAAQLVGQQPHARYLERINLASDAEPVPIAELAALIIKLANSSSTVNVLPSDSISVDNYNTHTDRASRLLGFETEVNLTTGLTRFINDYPYGKKMCPILRKENKGE